jgi:hypothetical protein
MEPEPKNAAAESTMVSTGIIPRNLNELYNMASLVAKGGLYWKKFGGNDVQRSTMAAAAVIQAGMEMGLKPMMAIRSLTVSTRGEIGVPGDLALAMVRSSPLYESYREYYTGREGSDEFAAVVAVKRKGEPEQTESFSVADAKRAGLWGKKDTPWVNYPRRMLKYRARGFILRDVFGDVLQGFYITEELDDFPGEREARPQGAAATQAPSDPALVQALEQSIQMAQDKKGAAGLLARVQSQTPASGAGNAGNGHPTPAPARDHRDAAFRGMTDATPPAEPRDGRPAAFDEYTEPGDGGTEPGGEQDEPEPADENGATDWDTFRVRMGEIAFSKNPPIPPQKVDAAITMAMGRDKYLAKPKAEIPETWYNHVIAAFAEDRFNIKNGRIVSPVRAEATAPTESS